MLHILFPHLFFFILVYNSNLQQTAERLDLRAKMQSTNSQKKKNDYLSHHWQTAKVDLDSLFFFFNRFTPLPDKRVAHTLPTSHPSKILQTRTGVQATFMLIALFFGRH